MIGIRVDNNSTIGMGHLFRCLSIANALVNAGEQLCFFCSSDSNTDFIIKSGYDCKVVFRSKYNDWCVEDEIACLKDNNISVLVVDSYYIDKDIIFELHEHFKILYIDDFINKDFDVDVIVNYNIEVTDIDYDNIAFQNRLVYTGISFFPLRENLKHDSLRRLLPDVKNVLITSGATDPCHCIDSILTELNVGYFTNIQFNVILGVFFDEEYIKLLQDKYENNVVFLNWTNDMKSIYDYTDMMIAPGATMVYEALSSGVPCLTYEFVDNQHAECIILNKLGVSPFIGNYSDGVFNYFDNRIKVLFEEEIKYENRLKRFNIFSKMFDGMGTQRISEIIINLKQ